MIQPAQLELPFEQPISDSVSPHVGEDECCAPDPVAQHIRNRATYARPRLRQGVRDRYAATRSELQAVGADLIASASSDPRALSIILAAIAGVDPPLAQEIRLIDSSCHDWTIGISLAQGTMHTDMDRIYSGAARPSDEVRAEPACRAIVKPLPQSVLATLTERSSDNPAARTLGDLLPPLTFDTRVPLSRAEAGRLRQTFARFRDGLGPLCLDLGIGHYVSAALLNNFGLICKSRLYYVVAANDSIIQAARLLYRDLGWGEPVCFPAGLPFGARTCPSAQDVLRAYQWFVDQVTACRPANRASIAALIGHHNAVVRAAAFVISFCIGAREVKAYKLYANLLATDADFFPFHDKRAPGMTIDRDVVANRVVREQFGLLRAHLIALERRLMRLKFPVGCPLYRYIKAVLSGQRTWLLCLITDRGQLRPVGTGAIYRTLPAELRLAGNSGRSFWQTGFERAGLNVDDINLFSRHTSLGCEVNASTSVISLAERRAIIRREQERVLSDLGISAVAGLARTGAHHD